MTIGAASRAVAWFELAAARRPRWPAPLAAIALAHVRQGEPARALGAFRRAIEADRAWVERERPVVRTLANVVLRRAEEMEQSGRLDIARGLLEEVLELDLRRVPSNVRFELRRRRQALSSGASEAAA
jgi:tetratricopeptide (TPR) repeat protein